MSIHKSKGLEFPIVIVAGMGKQFNRQDSKGDVLMHASLGIGLESVDLETRTKCPTLIRNVIAREEVLESMGRRASRALCGTDPGEREADRDRHAVRPGDKGS